MGEFEARFQSRVVSIHNREGVVVSMKPRLLAEDASYWLEHASSPKQKAREMRALAKIAELNVQLP